MKETSRPGASAHHLALRTHDVAALVAFYVEVVGLSVVRSNGERSTWLRGGELLVMIEQAHEGEPMVRDARATKEMMAFATDDLVEAEARCARAGIAVEDRTTYTLYIRDPDGRRVGLSTYAFEV